MEWFSVDGANWLAVVLAFVASFALGWIWYSPQGLFKPWATAAGITPESMHNAKMGPAFAQTILANALGVVVLAVLMVNLGVGTWWEGLLLGGLIGLVFRGGAHALHNGFAQRSGRVTFIDAAHDASALAIAGAILGLMG